MWHFFLLIWTIQFNMNFQMKNITLIFPSDREGIQMRHALCSLQALLSVIFIVTIANLGNIKRLFGLFFLTIWQYQALSDIYRAKLTTLNSH